MDVLFLMKAAQTELLSTCGRVRLECKNRSDSILRDIEDLRRMISRFLDIEKDLLLPEFTEIMTTLPRVAMRYVEHHDEVAQVVRDLDGQPSEQSWTQLAEILERYVRWQREELMPKIREIVPTQEREDLGRVYLDLTDDSELALRHA